ncbi:hypothetical protein GCM10028808_31980 [Spirosoma migulaei]
MDTQGSLSRRAVVKSSIFGFLTASIPSIGFSKGVVDLDSEKIIAEEPLRRYPAIEDDVVAEVVGASHFNLDRVKVLVNQRPELARATWDWAFGDWETAIGAASHVGRRDIVEFLLSKGARPDLFTYAMLGSYDTVKAMVEATPGVQRITGPHGISLLQHAKNGLRADGLTNEQKNTSSKLIDYLEGLGNAGYQEVDIPMEAVEKEKYLGDYKYGEGSSDGFSIKMNLRKLLSLGKLGKSGGALYQKSRNVFTYNGTPSVTITFDIVDSNVRSLTIQEPTLTLTARKV